MKPNWKAGYDILMEYWDSMPEDEKENINERLIKVGC